MTKYFCGYLPRTLVVNLGNLKRPTSCFASHTLILDISTIKNPNLACETLITHLNLNRALIAMTD